MRSKGSDSSGIMIDPIARPRQKKILTGKWPVERGKPRNKTQQRGNAPFFAFERYAGVPRKKKPTWPKCQREKEGSKSTSEKKKGLSVDQDSTYGGWDLKTNDLKARDLKSARRDVKLY